MAAGFYYIIFNPAAGSGNAVKIYQAVKKELDARQLAYETRVTRYPGHAVQLARQIGSFNDRQDAVVLVVGGDGTLNETISGLHKTPQSTLPVGYIPAGSGNDFARGAGLSAEPLKALKQVLAAEEPLILDIGHYQEHTHHEEGCFVNNIGIGFDAAVVAANSHSRVKRILNRLYLGKLSYFAAAIKTFFITKPFDVVVYDQAGKMELIPRAFLVDATNHPYFGGGIRFMPKAVPTDGELDLVVVEHPNWLAFLFLFVQMIRGKAEHYPQVHYFKGKRLRLETSALETGQKDGEEMGTRAFELEFTTATQAFWFKR